MPRKQPINYYQQANKLLQEKRFSAALRAARIALSPHRGPGTPARTISTYTAMKLIEIRCTEHLANIPLEHFLLLFKGLLSLSKTYPNRSALDEAYKLYNEYDTSALARATYIYNHAIFLFNKVKGYTDKDTIDLYTTKIMSFIDQAMLLYSNLDLPAEVQESLDEKVFICKVIANQLASFRTIESLKLAESYYKKALAITQHSAKPISDDLQQSYDAVKKQLQQLISQSKKKKTPLASNPACATNDLDSSDNQSILVYSSTFFRRKITSAIAQVIIHPSADQISKLSELVENNDCFASIPVPENPQGDNVLLLALRQQQANTTLVLTTLLKPVIQNNSILDLQQLFSSKDNAGRNVLVIAELYQSISQLKEAIAVAAYEVLGDKAESFIHSAFLLLKSAEPVSTAAASGPKL